jgi:RNA polymerase sigma factor (sigma-70 family)
MVARVLTVAAPTRHGITPPILLTIAAARLRGETISVEAEELVVRLFRSEGRSLVRLARLFVDDRDAAEDVVQEAFLRLARHSGRIDDIDRAPAYLRSIVLNLARDHNRRGLVSLRHHPPSGREVDVDHDASDQLVRSEANRQVLDAVRRLPTRQRDCIALRYFEEQSIDGIAATLGLSTNSVKTHLQRAMASLDRLLGESLAHCSSTDSSRPSPTRVARSMAARTCSLA